MLFVKRLLLSLLAIMNTCLYAQNIGVKTISPQAVLDVNGSVAIREGSPLSIVNGTNNNVTIDSMSFYRIAAPTAAFTITGFTNGSDGRLLTLLNTTNYAMILKHQSILSTATNCINTGGSDMSVPANGTVSLSYNAALGNWIVTGSQGVTPTFPSITTGALTDSIVTVNNGILGKYAPQPYISNYAWSRIGNSGTTWNTHFLGTTDNVSMRFRTNNTEKMVLDSVGRLGIGTSLPKGLLHLTTASALSTDTAFLLRNSVNDRLLNVNNDGSFAFYPNYQNRNSFLKSRSIHSDGRWAIDVSATGAAGTTTQQLMMMYLDRLGIGTGSAPTMNSAITIAGGRTYVDLLTVSEGQSIYGPNNIYGLNIGKGSVATYINAPTGANVRDTLLLSGRNLTFKTGYTEGYRVLIDSLGKMAIGGTSTPQYKLDIDAKTKSAGNPIRLQGLLAGSTSDSIISSNSGVLRRLSIDQIVSNAWNITGNSGTSDGTHFIGTTDNVPLSIRVNNEHAGRIDQDGLNTAFGYLALNVNKAKLNTGIGAAAGLSNESGEQNTFVGVEAGKANVAGNNNTYIGVSAGLNNEKGESNVSLGHSAGINSRASENTFLGASAGYGNVDGTANAFVGFNAGYKNETGEYNTFIGYSAGINNIKGSGNYFGGYYAGVGNESGSGNTVLGTKTGSTLGDNSNGVTLVGVGSDVLKPGFTNATAIGQNAIVGASNSLVLGGTGSDAVNVGINFINPQYKLDIDAVSGSTGNPIRLQGLLAGSVSDSIVSSSSGILRRLSINQIMGNSWNITGNAGTIDGTNFIGTTDNIPLSIKVNNQKAGRIDQDGYNTAFGYLALNVNTAKLNTGIGTNAGTLNETGEQNTYLGAESGRNNIKGNNNTYLGVYAGAKNDKGDNNVAVGQNAGISSQASENTFIGMSSGYANSSGTANAFMGFYAGYKNETGSSNTFIGHNAGINNSTGNDNYFAGYYAGVGNETGSGNTALGTKTGATLGSGSNNITLIGISADVSKQGLTNATAIGQNAVVGENNSLVLGGTGSNAVFVGINKTVPKFRLDIDAMANSSGDPVRFQGLSAGSVSDSIVSSSSGVLRRLSIAQIIGSSAWSLLGNSGTTAGTNFIGTTDAQALAFRANNTEWMRMSTTGSIGLGLTSPSVKLHQDAGTSTATYHKFTANATTGQLSTDGFDVGIDAAGNAVLKQNEALPMILSTNATERLRILSGGNIGIGTVNPVSLLDVNSNAAITPVNISQVYNANAVDINKGGADVGMGLNITDSGGSSSIQVTKTGGSGLHNTNLKGLSIAATYQHNGASGGGKGIEVTTINNSVGATSVFGADITTTGNASGTTAYGLRVNTASTSGTAYAIYSNTGLNYFSDKVGLNTSTPQYKLDINANTGSAGDPLRLQGLQAGLTSDSIVSSNNGVLRRLSIAQVLGAGSWTTTGNASTVDGTNFIGTTDNIPFNIRVNNQKAGRIDNTLFNVFLGYTAGNITTGQYNTFLGHEAGRINAAGQGNTAVGYATLYTNSTGDNNSAVGVFALGSTTNAWGNSALGYRAAYNLTTGGSNVAIGDSSIHAATTGGNNVALGYRAGLTLTTGSQNTFLGATADVSSATLTNAAAIGYGASVTASNKIRLGNTSVTSVETSGSFTTVSDRRLKTNIEDNNIGLNFINAVRPVNYELKSQKGIVYDGFIAQEIDSIMQKQNIKTFSGLAKPADTEGGYYTVSYATFVVPLVNAVKELDVKSEQLKVNNEKLAADNAALKAELDNMKAENATLKADVYDMKQDVEAIKAALKKQ